MGTPLLVVVCTRIQGDEERPVVVEVFIADVAGDGCSMPLIPPPAA